MFTTLGIITLKAYEVADSEALFHIQWSGNDHKNDHTHRQEWEVSQTARDRSSLFSQPQCATQRLNIANGQSLRNLVDR